jgi:hypothetical protein
MTYGTIRFRDIPMERIWVISWSSYTLSLKLYVRMWIVFYVLDEYTIKDKL